MLPHAPLTLAEVAGETNAEATLAVREAAASIDLREAEALVVASPHGSRTGVYARARGDLDAFGPRGVAVAPPEDDSLTAALAQAWDRPVLDARADHGIVVPLRLLGDLDVPVVAVAFEEGAGTEDAPALARAVRSLGPRIAFVASANLSAGLDERSPLPSLPGAAAADEAVLRALREDPEGLAGLAPVLERAGSCGAAPLAAFGALFAGASCDVLAYDHPFGVGYAVALTR